VPIRSSRWKILWSLSASAGRGSSHLEIPILLNNIEPQKWYKVRDVAKIIGWGEDAAYDWVHGGLLEAFLKPITSSRRKRTWTGMTIQGCEIIRFVKAHLSTNRQRVRRNLR
jgi:hypothetical protein